MKKKNRVVEACRRGVEQRRDRVVRTVMLGESYRKRRSDGTKR